MSRRRIIVVVSPEGDTSINMFGFSGPTCTDASAFLESALGVNAGRRIKSDWYRIRTRLEEDLDERQAAGGGPA